MPVASVREVPLGLVRGHGQQPLQVRAEELLNELHVRQQLEPLDVLLVLDPHAPLSHTHTHMSKEHFVLHSETSTRHCGHTTNHHVIKGGKIERRFLMRGRWVKLLQHYEVVHCYFYLDITEINSRASKANTL